MPQGISQREFARRDGCSKTIVRRAIQTGALVAFDDGTLNPALVKTPWRRGNYEANAVPGKLDTFSEAQRKKENYLALLRQLEYEVKSGRLCDVEAVERGAFELTRDHRDSLANWPSRVAPLIAAELGVDQVKLAVVLEKHVREYLAERSDRPIIRLAS